MKKRAGLALCCQQVSNRLDQDGSIEGHWHEFEIPAYVDAIFRMSHKHGSNILPLIPQHARKSGSAP
jgi:hypothetical protein